MRDEIFSTPDLNLYRHVGYFCCWFGLAEIQITFLLALLNRSPDFVGFELIAKGMDARVKTERLVKLLKLRTNYDRKSNLGQRIEHFEKKIIPVRNKIAHSGFYSTNGGQTLHFPSLTSFPVDGPEQPIPESDPAQSMSYLNLFKAGLWLQYFTEDLGSIWKGVPPEQRVFKIAHPRSWVSAEYLDSPPPKTRPSTGHMRAQNQRE